MKIFTCFLFLLFCIQLVYAAEYPPNEETIKKEFGLKYYELRKQLPYDEGGNIYFDEAIVKKEKVLDILLKLLNDKTIIATKKGSLFENLNVSSSMSMFYENQFVINGIIYLLVFSNGYRSYPQAISDHFNKFDVKDKQIIKSIIDIENKYYSMLYQRIYKMPKKCSDILDKYNINTGDMSKEFNDEAIKSLKEAIDSGCIYIGILRNYMDALIQEGKYNNLQDEARKHVVSLYLKYFDELSNSDLNQLAALELLQKVSLIKEGERDVGFVIGINKKVVKLISSGRLKLEDKPQWFRVHYISLLSKTLNAKDKNQIKEKDEIIAELKSIIHKKGNIFILKDEEIPKDLSNQEKEFLQLIQK
jgi:hypothetical protein